MNTKPLSLIARLGQEFTTFAIRGNALDLAVGVIIGASFGKIVSALVDDLLMPIIGLFVGAIDLSGLTIQHAGVTIAYGHFLQALLDFFIIAFCVFLLIKGMNFIIKKHGDQKKIEQKDVYDAIMQETRILADIRQLLVDKKQ